MKEDYDFIAYLKYRTSDEGGRMTPTRTGYRPQVRFDFEKSTSSGRQVFINKDWVSPGENVEAEITLMSPHLFENKLYEGLNFEFIEGAKIIGVGEILRIKNETLKNNILS
ncbi:MULTISPECIES: EF-Tu C-terminal domain-related protein [Chryseobacterium]|jgi:translation elongation factor EF-Tu-like GTPase|uniref:EF-Tu C-terminal domain-related protein n=1 Tax=Chryseobacterium TaxID=59732 RepID=UPI0008338AFB|nr:MULTISPECIES: hypothetical protein [Chryseobacterium]AZA58932.1 hypothetical protein EG350_17855 [Chryseobacterium shandongense]